MKKFFNLLVFVFAVLVPALLFSAAGCLETPETGGSIVIHIGAERFEVTGTEHEFIGQVLDELSETRDLAFSYDTFPPLGRFPYMLGDLQAGSNSFIALYISLLEPRWSTPQSRTIDGTAFYFANYGIDGLPVLDGVQYLFVLSTF